MLMMCNIFYFFIIIFFQSADVREFLQLDNPRNASITNDEDPEDTEPSVDSVVCFYFLILKIFPFEACAVRHFLLNVL